MTRVPQPVTLDDSPSTNSNTTTGTRKRAKHSRSRLGCGVCRIRRVRCDQTRPACQRCTSTGRTCDGYKQSPSGSELPKIIPSYANRAHLVEMEEPYALRHFQHRTSRQLAGDFEDGFWHNLVLQACVKEPCIRHMTVALACLHNGLQPDPQEAMPLDRLTSLAVSHYLAGIHRLNTLIARHGWSRLDMILMCSILCILFEWRQSNHASALIHLQNALHILQQWRLGPKSPFPRSSSESYLKRTSPEGHFITKTLVPILAKMVMQAMSLVDRHAITIALPKFNLSEELDVSREGFITLTDARDSLFNFLAQEYLQTPGMSGISADAFSIQQAQWSARLDVLLQHQPRLALDDAASIMTLEIWRKATHLMALEKMAECRTVFEQFVHVFREMLELCGKIVQSQASAFTADISIVLPMYFVAFNCPDIALRREAIALLESSKRHEGIWESGLAATLAKRALEAHELGLLQKDPQAFWNLKVDIEHSKDAAGT